MIPRPVWTKTGRAVSWHTVVKAYPCPTCTAGPTERCHTVKNKPKNEPHVDRTRLAASNGWQMPDD